MPFQVTVHHELSYLLLEVAGMAETSDHRGVVALAAAVCAAAPYRKCLIDLRRMHTEMPFTEHLQLGTFVGETLRSLEKVASVVTPAVRNGTSEKAAQRVGARLRAFTDIEDAKAWILS
jgi:hypothetical protein